MSDRDRLTKFSVVGMLTVTLLAAALFGALYLSFGFFLDMEDRSDRHIVQLSEHIRENFAREIGDAIHSAESILGELRKTDPPAATQWPKDSYSLLAQQNLSLVEKYPFLVHVMLLGAKPKGEGAAFKNPLDEPSDLRQIIKFSSNRIPTPLISVPASRFSFLARLLQGQFATQNSSQFVLQSFVSPSTGEFLPSLIFNPETSADAGARILATTQLPSLVNVLLPQGFGFAVVDPEGQVLFHSDPSRNLHENFFGETDDPDELKASLRRNEPKHLSLRYGGRAIRAFVQPLGCEDTEKIPNCIHNLEMSLIVFRGVDEQKDRLSSVGANFLMYLLALPLLVSAFVLVTLVLKGAVWPAASIASARRRIWPREEEKNLYLLKGIWALLCFVAAVLIAVAFRLAAGRFTGLPLIFPAAMLLVLGVCILGLFVLARRPERIGKLTESTWIKRCENRMPLSAAYALRVFAVMLAVSGTLSLIVFQLAVSSSQLRFESDSYRSLAAALESRKLRYLSDFHKSFEDTPRNSSDLWPQYCRDRVSKQYDVYDWRVHEQPGVLSLLRSAPLLNDFSFFERSPEVHALPDPCPDTPTPAAPQTASMGREPVWNALPFPSLPNLLLFYLPCLLLFIGIFLWVHRIVRRLFILDFREPSRLPCLTKDDCQARMQNAIQSQAGPLDRILIFAHPRSGTGVALEKILDSLKPKSPETKAPCTMVDFGKISDTEIGEHSKLLSSAMDSKVVILDNFEVRLPEPKERIRKLAFLEALVYSHKPAVYVLTSIDPLLLVESLSREQQSDHLQSELNRWTRLLGNFERFVFEDDSKKAVLNAAAEEVRQKAATKYPELDRAAVEEYVETLRAELNPTLFLQTCACSIQVDQLDFTSPRRFEDSLVTQVRHLADGYYRVIWLNCTGDERLALYQLAKDDWLNPMNEVAISHLIQKQLIQRDGAYRLMNVSFRSFVLEAVSARELATWQKQQNLSLWPALRMALGLAMFLVILFVSYFWRDIFDVYLSYFVALAGGAAALFRIVTQFFTKDSGKLAALAGADASKPGEEAA
jgi:hypothetical protein